MKKLVLFSIIFIIVLLSGCGLGKQPMDQLAEDNKYHYQNRTLGFALNLPSEFEYYQVQRKNTNYYIDIEFFVPTSDKDYLQEVPSYAKPVIVRIFSRNVWEGIEDDKYKSIFQEVGQKGNKVYTIVFWDNIPSDWQNKWSKDMQEEIIQSLVLK
jgi:hypothetical protein